MRALILLIAVSAVSILLYGAGFVSGRAGRKRAVLRATEHTRPVIAAARGLAHVDWLSQPSDALLQQTTMKYAIREHDDSLRRALDA